jgi:glycosyltransferase involved in cell wall biosynthesis
MVRVASMEMFGRVKRAPTAPGRLTLRVRGMAQGRGGSAEKPVGGVKVVHVITGLAIGGAEMALCRLLEHSSRDGSDITHGVVSLMKGGALRHRIRAAGVELEELDLTPGSIPVSRAFRLAEAIRRQRPTLLHGWMYHGNMAATVAKYLQRRSWPLIWGIRYSPGVLRDEKSTTRILIRVEGPLSRLPAAIIYCSQASARQHESLGYHAEKTVVIPNGFDSEAFKPDPEAKARLVRDIGVSRDTPVVGIVARFHPQKDHRNITAAVAELSRRRPDVHFVFVGPDVDPTNQSLVEMIRSFGVEDRVTLLGECHDVTKMMPGLDLLCSGSAWGEAFPNVLAEAMACGVPCVATDVGDSALIVGSTGIVVPPRDPEALAAAMSRLIALAPEERHQLGQAARWRIIKHFSLPEVARRYDDLYQRVALCHESSR